MTEEERQLWNAALGGGNKDEISALQDALLVKVHTKIMNDDPRYSVAGWKET